MKYLKKIKRKKMEKLNKKVIFATKNKGKVVEVKRIFENSGIEIFSLLDFEDDVEIVEDGLTFEENAKIKAKAVFEKYNVPTLADDSGLVTDQLNGAPGVFSARFAGEDATDKMNNDKLIQMLKAFPEPHPARFVCSAVYYDGNDYISTSGAMEGKIIHTPKGVNGFGYDPLFIAEGYERTNGELSLDEKNKISHRAKAFTKLKGKVISAQ
jgi:XTP/dITP diphosphohydrolase